jgi:hypothetical protein
MLSLNLDNSLSVVVDQPGAWVSTQETVNAAGQPVPTPPWAASCLLKTGPQGIGACLTRLAQAGYRQRVTYQPASRFWTFQWIETGLYFLLAVLIAGLCGWWLRRRLT